MEQKQSTRSLDIDIVQSQASKVYEYIPHGLQADYITFESSRRRDNENGWGLL